MTEREKKLKTVQMHDFALEDAVLYLDGHPTDENALEYYNQQKYMLIEATKDYETEFGPMTNKRNSSSSMWYWSDDPWPWEGDAN